MYFINITTDLPVKNDGEWWVGTSATTHHPALPPPARSSEGEGAYSAVPAANTPRCIQGVACLPPASPAPCRQWQRWQYRAGLAPLLHPLHHGGTLLC